MVVIQSLDRNAYPVVMRCKQALQLHTLTLLYLEATLYGNALSFFPPETRVKSEARNSVSQLITVHFVLLKVMIS